MLNRSIPSGVADRCSGIRHSCSRWHPTAPWRRILAEDALKQIIEEGNPAYLDWSTALADRELIGRLYADNGYRLLWSDGAKAVARPRSFCSRNCATLPTGDWIPRIIPATASPTS